MKEEDTWDEPPSRPAYARPVEPQPWPKALAKRPQQSQTKGAPKGRKNPPKGGKGKAAQSSKGKPQQQPRKTVPRAARREVSATTADLLEQTASLRGELRQASKRVKESDRRIQELESERANARGTVREIKGHLDTAQEIGSSMGVKSVGRFADRQHAEGHRRRAQTPSPQPVRKGPTSTSSDTKRRRRYLSRHETRGSTTSSMEHLSAARDPYSAPA